MYTMYTFYINCTGKNCCLVYPIVCAATVDTP